MEPIENEPKGWEENRQNNASDFSIDTDKETKTPEIETDQNDLAGNADGNLPPEEVDDDSSNATNKGQRSFTGDFAEPQHED